MGIYMQTSVSEDHLSEEQLACGTIIIDFFFSLLKRARLFI